MKNSETDVRKEILNIFERKFLILITVIRYMTVEITKLINSSLNLSYKKGS